MYLNRFFERCDYLNGQRISVDEIYIHQFPAVARSLIPDPRHKFTHKIERCSNSCVPFSLTDFFF